MHGLSTHIRRKFSESFFVKNPKLMLKYLGYDGSGSTEICTTDSLNDKEQNVQIKFSLRALSFSFVNCTIKLQFIHIYKRIKEKECYLRYHSFSRTRHETKRCRTLYARRGETECL